MSVIGQAHAGKILEYRAKAVEAVEQAMQASDLDVRRSWETIARSYHQMAEWLEKGIGPDCDPAPPRIPGLCDGEPEL